MCKSTATITMGKIKSVAQQVKEFGAKVTRELAGYYVYHGVNFIAKINQVVCERTYWEIDVYSDDTDKRVYDNFHDYCTYERKGDVVWALLCLDKSLSENK